jgi:hypothetical protein
MKELLKKIALYGAISSFAFVLAIPVLAEEDSDGGRTNGTRFACAEDARQCPDGSFVGRTGSRCEFVCPGVATTTKNKIQGNDVGSIEPTACGRYGCQNGDVQEKREEIKKQMQKAIEVFNQKREEAKNEFEHAREDYKNKIEEVKQDKKELSDSLKEDKKSHNEESREKVVEKAHNMIDNTIGAMVNRLEALKNKVNGVKLLEADKTEITAEINKDILWLNTKSTELQNMASSTTATASTTALEIRTKSKEVKAYWDTTIKVTVKRVSGEILAGRLNYIVSKEEELANTLTTEIATLKTAGKNVASLELSLADAKAKIVTAKAKIAEAKVKFKTIVSADTSKGIYEEGKNLVDSAKDVVKEANKLLINVRNGAGLLGGTSVTVTGTATTTATSTTP